MVNLCAHSNEWDEYHRIRNEQIFLPINIEYDKNHETITAQNHYHFVLYHGVKIVSTAHIEFLGNKEAALRTVATDTKYNKGYAKFLIEFLEKWMNSQSISTIKLHSARDAEAFYRKLGYVELHFL
ncbi:MAG UNVERIFIED_CONTAM: GNAT family N-acetyltransferase [Rickettsiaceae bacterium]